MALTFNDNVIQRSFGVQIKGGSSEYFSLVKDFIASYDLIALKEIRNKYNLDIMFIFSPEPYIKEYASLVNHAAIYIFPDDSKLIKRHLGIRPQDTFTTSKSRDEK